MTPWTDKAVTERKEEEEEEEEEKVKKEKVVVITVVVEYGGAWASEQPFSIVSASRLRPLGSCSDFS